MLVKCRCYQLRFDGGVETCEPEEQDSRVKQTLAKDEFSKVFICSQQDRIRLLTAAEDLFIVNAGIEFGDVQNFVLLKA